MDRGAGRSIWTIRQTHNVSKRKEFPVVANLFAKVSFKVPLLAYVVLRIVGEKMVWHPRVPTGSSMPFAETATSGLASDL